MRPGHTTASPAHNAACASLVSFLAFNCLAGVIAGWIMLGGLLWLDVAGLGALVTASDLFPVPLLMLLAAFAITFGAVAMGSSIIGLGRGGGPGGGWWQTIRKRVTLIACDVIRLARVVGPQRI